MSIHSTITHNTVAVARIAVRLGLALCAAVVFVAAAQAQTTNKFISANGNDANNCSRTAPCKTLQRGVDVTASNSVLQILDSGAYGPATLAKSITIAAEGVLATTQAITINGSNADVVLRGLLVSGRGSTAGASGITITAARSVHIVRCEIERFSFHGITQTIDAELFVSDSISRGNGQSGISLFAPFGTLVRLTIDNSRFENNGDDGIHGFRTHGTISRSIASGNGGSGVQITSTLMDIISTTAANNAGDGFTVLNSSKLSLENSMASQNAASGLSVLFGTLARISNSALTNNGVGITNNGITHTRQNNMVSGNSSNLTGNALTPLGGI